jgi:hypothetical protein
LFLPFRYVSSTDKDSDSKLQMLTAWAAVDADTEQGREVSKF